MDDDVLEIDSPMEHPVDVDEDSDLDDFNLDGSPSAASIARKAKLESQRLEQLEYPQSLPYQCESLEEFDQRLDHICRRLVDCVQTKDYDVGLIQWNHKLQCLLSLKYPVPRATRAKLARLFYQLTVLPGMEIRLIELSSKMCMTLIESKKKLDIRDLVLPWKPLFSFLEKELFPKQRRTGLTNISSNLLDLAESSQRFFDPNETEEMLKTFLPRMDGSSLNSVIATQAFLVHFLPISHPQRWLPAMFRLWESFTSSLFDDQMLDLLARLADMHVSDPSACSSKAASNVGRYADDTPSAGWTKKRTDGEFLNGSLNGKNQMEVDASAQPASTAEAPLGANKGLWKETGIFTDDQFALIMTKCLRSAGLPVGASKAANAALMAQSSSVRTGPDAATSDLTLSMKKPTDRLHSFAVIIAYSMAKDGPISGKSTNTSQAPTPSISTPQPGSSPKLGPSVPSTQRTYLAGSKALDHLARFVQATESYFHPSNWGPWQVQLSTFVQHLTWEFSRRVKEEERKECKTPQEWRITPEIQKEFVQTLRTVCLLSMFSKDPLTIASSQASLKRMSILEPALIFPAVLERAFNSLEALETTHRTTAVITALSTLAIPMVSREIYPAGGKSLVPLLHLCLPGIDLNDPMKTISTSIFILNSLMTIRVDDLTRLEQTASNSSDGFHMEVDGEENKELTKEEEDALLRLSTSGFEDWAVSFFRRVLALFEALPEEGKGGKTGGKSEEQVINTVLAACDSVCNSLSPHLFETTFKIILDYCSTTVSGHSVRVIGSLVSCFARANPKRVLQAMLPICAREIESELKHGASSNRTTSTSIPVPSDASLHWWLSVLNGAMSFSGSELLAHKATLIPLFQLLIRDCKTERGYSFGSALIKRALTTILSIYPKDQKFMNPKELEDQELLKNSHLYWGKLYKAKEVEIEWHVSSDQEIDFCLEILDNVVEPTLTKFEQLHEPGKIRDKVWSNDFCRNLYVLRNAWSAIPNLIDIREGGGGTPAMDSGDDVAEFIEPPPRFKSGFILSDPNDSRYQKVEAFRYRFGVALEKAAQSTQDSEAEDQIDAAKLLIRSIRTYMTVYSFDSDSYKSNSRSLAFYRQITKLYAKQKEFPRVFWLRRAALYHTSRARLNSFHRKRSPLDDKLISHILEFSLSNYVGIRKTAQGSFDTISQHYDGTRMLSLPKLLDNVKPGVEDDRMKGALYVLGSKAMSNLAIVDSRFSTPYITALLGAQHHSKPSIQKLVRGVINDFVIRFPEPAVLRSQIDSIPLAEAAKILEKGLAEGFQSADASLLERVAGKREDRTQRIDQLHAELVPQVLATARSGSTHWAFGIFAARLLRALVRKDRPLSEEPAKYLTEQVISENPQMRRYAQAALTKILFFIKLRTLCTSDEALLQSQPTNPLKHSEDLPMPVPRSWTEEHLARFARPLEPDSRLRDKSSIGWLVWEEKNPYYEVPPFENPSAFEWDPASQAALDAVKSLVSSPAWWDSFFRHLAQEKTRDYIAAEQINLVKSLFQIYGPCLLPLVKGQIEEFIAERDRHKHRAAAEMISGIYRGSKHWPMKSQNELWTWLEGLLPKIFKAVTPDGQASWQMAVEYILQDRDPRRAMPLVNYVVNAAKESLDKDTAGISPWEQSKTQNLLRGALIALNVKFTAWSGDFIKLYTQNWDHDFAEVRSVLSESLADLELLTLNPSFGNVEEFLQACQTGKGSLLARPEMYETRLKELSATLRQWREQRIPTSQGTSQYDRAALTALLWISTTLGDHRNSALAGQVISFLPDIFSMLELHDNAELSVTARAVLTKISTYNFTSDAVAPLIRAILMIIKQSTDSWRARLDALPVLQVVYFQNLFHLSPSLVQEIIELLFTLLRDAHLEVREMAATTLSGIVRCSQRHLIRALKQRFTDTVVSTRLPKRGHSTYQEKIVTLHSGILGASALLAAFPYEVPDWMPSLICETVAQHTDDPVPIVTTVRKSAADFKRTHTDTWSEDQHKFDPDQLQEVNDWTSGRADYFA